jgi:hypothetical protein
LLKLNTLKFISSFTEKQFRTGLAQRYKQKILPFESLLLMESYMVDTSRKVCSYVFLLKQICTQKHDLGLISTPSPAAITGKIWSFHHTKILVEDISSGVEIDLATRHNSVE